MATFDTTRPYAPRSAGVFNHIFSVVAEWNDARVTRKALSQLSARELEDIGLVRGDIDTIAEGGYR